MDLLGRLLSEPATTALEKALDAAALRHQATANNLANVNTPGFKRTRVGFEDELEGALEALGGGELPQPAAAVERPAAWAALQGLTPRVVKETDTSLRNDGNNVDVETELALLNQNALWYTALSRQLTLQFSLLRQVITEGRR